MRTIETLAETLAAAVKIFCEIEVRERDRLNDEDMATSTSRDDTRDAIRQAFDYMRASPEQKIRLDIEEARRDPAGVTIKHTVRLVGEHANAFGGLPAMEKVQQRTWEILTEQGQDYAAIRSDGFVNFIWNSIHHPAS